MKLTDAIKQALEKKKGEHGATGETAVPESSKNQGPKPKSSVANKPPRKSAGRGR